VAPHKSKKAQAKRKTRARPAKAPAAPQQRPAAVPHPEHAASPLLSADGVRQLNRQVGNRATARALAGQEAQAGDTAPIALSPAAPNAVHRQGDDQTDQEAAQFDRITAPQSVAIAFDPPAVLKETVTIHSYDDLGRAYGVLSDHMFLERRKLMPDEEANPYWETWDTYREDAENYNEYYIDQLSATVGEYAAGQPPVLSEVRDLRKMVRNVNDIGQWGHQAYTSRQESFQKALSDLQQQLAQADEERRNALRVKFLGGEPEADNTTGFLWALGDSLASLTGALIDAKAETYHFALVGGQLLPAAVSTANVVLNWATSSPAMAGTAFEALAPMNNVVNMGGLAHSLLGGPGSIATAYIGPMLGAVITALGKLQMRMIEKNDEWAEQFGRPVYSGAEPGGPEMWNYMVRAMRAPSPDDVPQPRGKVYDYFDDHREQFDSFTSSRMPTDDDILSGVDVDPAQFPRWLYYQRDQVWTLLYGAREAKKAKVYD
jgi:hypothetical protein